HSIAEKVPLAVCAALAASIARRKAERDEILERQGITIEGWEEAERHWAEAIRRETQRGGTTLLSAYDDAYIGQIEIERGPITEQEYARLIVASERGIEHEALVAMDLPRGAMLRLRRVWLKKSASDPILAKRVRDAVDEQ
ncbi:MAG TPA: hypothetical protein VM580_14075, partial [Labilithrix sp.]|nr:hypothetical protein [Labilithrix sp.]